MLQNCGNNFTKEVFFFFYIKKNLIINLKKIGIAYIIQKEKIKQKKGELLDYNTSSRIKMAMKDKNIWILILFILCGIVVGGLLGELARHVEFLSWLAYGQEFGLTSPIELDLSVIKLTFGLIFKINIASIIGIVLAIFIYKKV